MLTPEDISLRAHCSLPLNASSHLHQRHTERKIMQVAHNFISLPHYSPLRGERNGLKLQSVIHFA